LPKAHVEAPAVGSIILAAILLKFGGIGIFRLYFLFFISSSYLILFFLGRVCSICACCVQSDQKAIVAFSSINHITLLVLIFLQGSNISVIATLLIIFVHGGISRIIFFFIFILSFITHSRFNYQNQGIIYFLGGFFLLTIIIILNFAVPLTIPFISELVIIKRIIRIDKTIFFFLFFSYFFLVIFVSLY